MTKKNKMKVGNSLEDLLNEGSPNSKFEKNSPKSAENASSSDLENFLNPKEIIKCPPAFNRVKFTRKAFEDVILMSKAINEISQDTWGSDAEKLEVYCYVLTDAKLIPSGKPARITSIYIPAHTAGEMAVDVSPKAVLEVQKYLEKTDKILLGWAHSHGHHPVYSSKTDEKNHKTLLQDTSNYIELARFRMKYIYGITVNDASERFGVILTQYPCTHIQRAEDEEFDIVGEPYTLAESNQRYYELKTLIEERVAIIPPVNRFSVEEQLKTLSNEFLDIFLQNLRKSKNFLLEEMPDIFDEHFDILQNVLGRHDEILVDCAEESFHTFSERLMKAVKTHKDDI